MVNRVGELVAVYVEIEKRRGQVVQGVVENFRVDFEMGEFCWEVRNRFAKIYT